VELALSTVRLNAGSVVEGMTSGNSEPNRAATAAATVLLFGGLFPDVMPSTTDTAYSLTVHHAASTPYTLKVMTWAAVLLVPFVLLYQGWTYWVFRRRIGVTDIPTSSGLPRTPTSRVGEIPSQR
jgi:cytochrome d ubiquinol oxidase subunit II